jgi:hypothetical protein
MTFGKTDDLGSNPVEDQVHLHNMHAAMLRLPGFDHARLAWRHAGRDFWLTDVYGKVIVHGILARARIARRLRGQPERRGLERCWREKRRFRRRASSVANRAREKRAWPLARPSPRRNRLTYRLQPVH